MELTSVGTLDTEEPIGHLRGAAAILVVNRGGTKINCCELIMRTAPNRCRPHIRGMCWGSSKRSNL